MSLLSRLACPFATCVVCLTILAALATPARSQERNPFPQRTPRPEFPGGLEWINVKAPLTKEMLAGKFVLIDFWTFCCINCIHTIPELKKLEKAYPNELVVIGVHSAKFFGERDADNVTEAVLRYEIDHPIVNDPDSQVWSMYRIDTWPTLLLIDPEGNVVWRKSGESKFAEVEKELKKGLAYHRRKKTLSDKPLMLDPAASRLPETPLRFPGKVLADESSNRLFIADSNHNRLVVATLDGKLLDVIGSGQIGKADGNYTKASFNKPQGLALRGDLLYVADTENHLLRRVDLAKKVVVTIAGTGVQLSAAISGMRKSRQVALASPWDLFVHDKDLYVAMAGLHQIWRCKLDDAEIGPYAGNGREDVVDGPLLPRSPYDLGFSSFAQPSGLASDGTWLYVADSEGSSLRRVPLEPKKLVQTVVGTSHLPAQRLFTFGDRDGDRASALLQHVLGVVHVDGVLYIADTYNNKIKAVDPKTGEVKSLAGTGKPGNDDETGAFSQPAGISHARGTLYVADTNNHLIRTVDVKSGQVGTLKITGLAPPGAQVKPVARKPTFPGATQVKVPAVAVKAVNGEVKFAVEIKLPAGWKANPEAPAAYFPEAAGESGPIGRAAVGKMVNLPKPTAAFEFTLPCEGTGEETVRVSMNYYYCRSGDEGVCKVGAVVWTIPIKISADAKDSVVTLKHAAP